MGHKVGWLTLYAGVAAGADIILLPEIRTISKNRQGYRPAPPAGKAFSILAVAEGALPRRRPDSAKSAGRLRAEEPYPSIPTVSPRNWSPMSAPETRVCVPGHYQRGGPPCPYDRVLATRLGRRPPA